MWKDESVGKGKSFTVFLQKKFQKGPKPGLSFGKQRLPAGKIGKKLWESFFNVLISFDNHYA
jgi:hypothetical protein